VGEIDAVIAAIDADNPKESKDTPDIGLLQRLSDACAVYNLDEVDTVIAEIDSFKYSDDDGLAQWLRKSVDMMSFTQIVERLSGYL